MICSLLKFKKVHLHLREIVNVVLIGLRKDTILLYARIKIATVVEPKIKKTSTTSDRGRIESFDGQGTPFVGRPHLHLHIMYYLDLFMQIFHALLEVNLFHY